MAPASADRDAALRALLVDQVAASRVTERPTPASPARGREPGRFHLAMVTAGVAVLVVAASVTAITLSRPPSAGPAAPTQTVATATPSEAPSEASTAVPTEAPSEAPTEAPTEAPSETATPAPSDTVTPSRPLITPTGWHLKTRSELHDWVMTLPWAGEDPANTAIWEQENWTDIQCMAEHGFVFDPEGEQSSGANPPGLTADQQIAFNDALDGPRTDASYDWRTAGCHGRSVHLAGQDNAH